MNCELMDLHVNGDERGKLVAVEKGAEAGPCVMIRADMDALPFKVNGEDKVIHACGHDSHCAMLLAIASRLQVTYRTLVTYLSQTPGSMIEKVQNLEVGTFIAS